MLPKSYKLRVALWSCMISGIVLLVFMVGVTFNVKVEFAELVDHDMEAMAVAVLAGAKKDAIESDPFLGIMKTDAGSYRGAIYEDEEDLLSERRNVRLLAIRRPDRTFSYINALYWKGEYEAILEDMPVFEVGSFLSESESLEELDPEDDMAEARWEIRYYQKDGYGAYLAINQHENKDEYVEFMYMGLLALPLAFVVVALGGWWIGVYAVKPMKAISKVVSSIKTDDLAARVPHDEREDEIGELASLVNDMLERIERGYAQAKRFTADASHELRTPLAILQGEIEARMRESDVDAASSNRMLEEIRRLKTLTHSLLFLSKADAGNLIVEKEPLDFSVLVQQTMGDIEEISRESGLVFDASGIEAGVMVLGDASLIQQTVMNLLRNAVKFNEAGGTVRCSVVNRDGFARLLVGNSGAGIPGESREKVFERFHRVDEDRNRDKGGFGLGLNIAREIARAHGGEIELLDSAEGWTEFEFSLPLRQ